MENGEDTEKVDLVVDKILNTEFIENCSNYNLFLDNNLTSNNSFSIILSLKVGNWSNFMLLRKISPNKNFNKRPTKWENKSFPHFMTVQRLSLMKLSKLIQNLVLGNLLSKWSKKVWELTQAKTSKECVKNVEEKEEKVVVKRKKKEGKDVHNLEEEEENLRKKEVWTNLWRSKFWKRWKLYLVRRKASIISTLSEKIRVWQRKILSQSGLKSSLYDKVHW